MPVRGRQRNDGNGNSGSDDDTVDDQKSHQPQKFRAKLTCQEDFDHWGTCLRDYGFGHGDEYETMIEQGMNGGAQDDPDKNQPNWKVRNG